MIRKRIAINAKENLTHNLPCLSSLCSCFDIQLELIHTQEDNMLESYYERFIQLSRHIEERIYLPPAGATSRYTKYINRYEEVKSKILISCKDDDAISDNFDHIKLQLKSFSFFDVDHACISHFKSLFDHWRRTSEKNSTFNVKEEYKVLVSAYQTFDLDMNIEVGPLRLFVNTILNKNDEDVFIDLMMFVSDLCIKESDREIEFYSSSRQFVFAFALTKKLNSLDRYSNLYSLLENGSSERKIIGINELLGYLRPSVKSYIEAMINHVNDYDHPPHIRALFHIDSESRNASPEPTCSGDGQQADFKKLSEDEKIDIRKNYMATLKRINKNYFEHTPLSFFNANTTNIFETELKQFIKENANNMHSVSLLKELSNSKIIQLPVIASAFGMNDVIDELINGRTKMLNTFEEMFHHTSLLYALFWNQDITAKRLAMIGTKQRKSNSAGWYPLLWTGYVHDFRSVSKIKRFHEVNTQSLEHILNKTGDWDETPLHWAVLSNDINFFSKVRRINPNWITCKDVRGWTPIEWAIFMKKDTLVNYLLRSSGHIGSNWLGATLLYKGDIRIFEKLVAKCHLSDIAFIPSLNVYGRSYYHDLERCYKPEQHGNNIKDLNPADVLKVLEDLNRIEYIKKDNNKNDGFYFQLLNTFNAIDDYLGKTSIDPQCKKRILSILFPGGIIDLSDMAVFCQNQGVISNEHNGEVNEGHFYETQEPVSAFQELLTSEQQQVIVEHIETLRTPIPTLDRLEFLNNRLRYDPFFDLPKEDVMECENIIKEFNEIDTEELINHADEQPYVRTLLNHIYFKFGVYYFEFKKKYHDASLWFEKIKHDQRDTIAGVSLAHLVENYRSIIKAHIFVINCVKTPQEEKLSIDPLHLFFSSGNGSIVCQCLDIKFKLFLNKLTFQHMNVFETTKYSVKYIKADMRLLISEQSKKQFDELFANVLAMDVDKFKEGVAVIERSFPKASIHAKKGMTLIFFRLLDSVIDQHIGITRRDEDLPENRANIKQKLEWIISERSRLFSSDHPETAHSIYMLGKFLFEIENYQEAESKFDELANIVNQYGPSGEHFDCYHDIWKRLIRLNNDLGQGERHFFGLLKESSPIENKDSGISVDDYAEITYYAGRLIERRFNGYKAMSYFNIVSPKSKSYPVLLSKVKSLSNLDPLTKLHAINFEKVEITKTFEDFKKAIDAGDVLLIDHILRQMNESIELKHHIGAMLNMKDSNGNSSLLFATIHQYKNVVRRLLQHGALSRDYNKQCTTPLHWAAWLGNGDIFCHLMFRETDIIEALSRQNMLDQNVLHCACRSRNKDLVITIFKFLKNVNHKEQVQAFIKQTDVREWTLLHYAMCKDTNTKFVHELIHLIEAFELLDTNELDELKVHSDIYKRKYDDLRVKLTPSKVKKAKFKTMSKLDDFKNLFVLEKRRSSESSVSKKINPEMLFSIYAAVLTNDVSFLDYEQDQNVRTFDALVAYQDLNQQHLFFYAVQAGNGPIVEWYFNQLSKNPGDGKYNDDFAKVNSKKENILMWAAWNGSLEIYNLIVSNIKKFSDKRPIDFFSCQNEFGQTVLHCAAKNGISMLTKVLKDIETLLPNENDAVERQELIEKSDGRGWDSRFYTFSNAHYEARKHLEKYHIKTDREDMFGRKCDEVDTEEYQFLYYAGFQKEYLRKFFLNYPICMISYIQEIERLEKLLSDNKKVLIYEPFGYGKTTFLWSFVDQYDLMYRSEGVFIINADNPISFDQHIRFLAEKMGVIEIGRLDRVINRIVKKINNKNKPPHEKKNTDKKYLLVFTNSDDALQKYIEFFLSINSMYADIVISSNSKSSLKLLNESVVHLRCFFSKEKASDYLIQTTKKLNIPLPISLKGRILKHCEQKNGSYSPFRISLFINYIVRMTSQILPQDAVSLCRSVEDISRAKNENESIEDVLLWHVFDKSEPLHQHILLTICLLKCDVVPDECIFDFIKSFPNDLLPDMSIEKLRKVLGQISKDTELIRYYWVDRQVYIHKHIQTFILKRVRQDDPEKLVAIVNELLRYATSVLSSKYLGDSGKNWGLLNKYRHQFSQLFLCCATDLIGGQIKDKDFRCLSMSFFYHHLEYLFNINSFCIAEQLFDYYDTSSFRLYQGEYMIKIRSVMIRIYSHNGQFEKAAKLIIELINSDTFIDDKMTTEMNMTDDEPLTPVPPLRKPWIDQAVWNDVIKGTKRAADILDEMNDDDIRSLIFEKRDSHLQNRYIKLSSIATYFLFRGHIGRAKAFYNDCTRDLKTPYNGRLPQKQSLEYTFINLARRVTYVTNKEMDLKKEAHELKPMAISKLKSLRTQITMSDTQHDLHGAIGHLYDSYSKYLDLPPEEYIDESLKNIFEENNNKHQKLYGTHQYKAAYHYISADLNFRILALDVALDEIKKALKIYKASYTYLTFFQLRAEILKINIDIKRLDHSFGKNVEDILCIKVNIESFIGGFMTLNCFDAWPMLFDACQLWVHLALKTNENYHEVSCDFIQDVMDNICSKRLNSQLENEKKVLCKKLEKFIRILKMPAYFLQNLTSNFSLDRSELIRSQIRTNEEIIGLKANHIGLGLRFVAMQFVTRGMYQGIFSNVGFLQFSNFNELKFSLKRLEQQLSHENKRSSTYPNHHADSFLLDRVMTQFKRGETNKERNILIVDNCHNVSFLTNLCTHYGVKCLYYSQNEREVGTIEIEHLTDNESTLFLKHRLEEFQKIIAKADQVDDDDAHVSPISKRSVDECSDILKMASGNHPQILVMYLKIFKKLSPENASAFLDCLKTHSNYDLVGASATDRIIFIIQFLFDKRELSANDMCVLICLSFFQSTTIHNEYLDTIKEIFDDIMNSKTNESLIKLDQFGLINMSCNDVHLLSCVHATFKSHIDKILTSLIERSGSNSICQQLSPLLNEIVTALFLDETLFWSGPFGIYDHPINSSSLMYPHIAFFIQHLKRWEKTLMLEITHSDISILKERLGWYCLDFLKDYDLAERYFTEVVTNTKESTTKNGMLASWGLAKTYMYKQKVEEAETYFASCVEERLFECERLMYRINKCQLEMLKSQGNDSGQIDAIIEQFNDIKKDANTKITENIFSDRHKWLNAEINLTLATIFITFKKDPEWSLKSLNSLEASSPGGFDTHPLYADCLFQIVAYGGAFCQDQPNFLDKFNMHNYAKADLLINAIKIKLDFYNGSRKIVDEIWSELKWLEVSDNDLGRLKKTIHHIYQIQTSDVKKDEKKEGGATISLTEKNNDSSEMESIAEQVKRDLEARYGAEKAGEILRLARMSENPQKTKKSQTEIKR